MSGPFEVVCLDPALLAEPPEDLVARGNRLDRALWAESDPDEPPFPLGLTRARLREVWRSFEHHRWMATDDDGEAVGFARLDLQVDDPDDPTATVQLQVLPAARRQGLGTRLLTEAVAVAREHGRAVIGGETLDVVPAGAAFAEHHGAEAKLVQRQSQCRIDDVADDLLARWLEIPADVAAEYELWRSTGPYPEAEYGRIATVQNVIQTQPYDDLERRDIVFTAEHVAHEEAQRDWSLADRWTHFIRHRPSGDLVGYTRIYLWQTWPDMADQGDTAVDPAHRGRGLGKWLKGSMVHHLRTERPVVRRIRTTNAFTNGPMLAINEALGFRVTHTRTSWQATLRTTA